ncbi:MAG: hypothetical protein KDB86_00945 [Actinobacteria bacterium]|nr:hypothetical protein [Actinomycetota bacterium]
MSPFDFDDTKAQTYGSREQFEKTAVLLRMWDSEAVTSLRTSFGRQDMTGDFYVVADADSCYGVDKVEFERSHRQVAPDIWTKTVNVAAYQLSENARVATVLQSGARESVVDAEPGDWVVKHIGGEITVVKPEHFRERYEPRHG